MMNATERYLHFENIDMEQPNISSQCNECGQTFKADPKLGEGVDDTLLRIRGQFNDHKCGE
jgi:hypothetical protein